MNPLESLWSRVLEARVRRYRTGRLAVEKLGRPVVSIGNVTVGGTGKTPFIERLARWMLEEGRKPAILSRGYGRSAKGTVVVSDGSGGGPLVGPLEGGDEPVLLARRLPGAVIAVAARRAEAGRAAEAFSPDVFLLDDGFQHLALARDLDIVLLDSADPFGGERYPPFGGLREPLSALARADAIVFTRIRAGAPSAATRERVLAENRGARRFTAEIRPEGFCDEAGRPAGAPTGPVVAACGIARPESFSEGLALLGLLPAETLVFPDHRRYDDADIERIAAAAGRHAARAVVTTEKDAVKLAGRLPLPIVSVRLEAEVVEPEFFPFVRERLFGARPGAVGEGAREGAAP
jgi:tetraacyldisaccharide 4'-kinase